MKEIIAQKAVIREGEKYLVLLRNEAADNPFPRLWDFPGGRVEEGEDLLESLKREVREEIACEIGDIQNIKEQHVLVPGPIHFILYSAKIVSGEIVLSSEHVDFKWLERRKILKLPMMPYMREFLETESEGPAD